MNCSHNCLREDPGLISLWQDAAIVQKLGGVAPVSGQARRREVSKRSLRCLRTLLALLVPLVAQQSFAASPAITAQPQSQTIPGGANTSFSVAATGDGPLAYEWWGEFGPLLPVRTNASLSLTNVQISDGGLYKVIVRNSSGFAVSTPAILTVTPPPSHVGENFLWAQRTGGTGVNPGANLAVDSSGNSYLVGSFTGVTTIGTTNLVSSGGSDAFLAKFDRTGALAWARTIGGPADDAGFGIAVDKFGNTRIVGIFSGNVDFDVSSLTNAGGTDIFVACYDRAGTPLWATCAGSTGDDRASRIAVDAAGNTYVAGSFPSVINFGNSTMNSAGDTDIILAKLSSSGVPLWAKRFGGASTDTVTGLAIGPAGTVTVAGLFRGPVDFGGISLAGSGATEVFLAQCNSAGTVQWARKITGADTNEGASVVVAQDGSAYLSGAFSGVTTFGAHSLTNREFIDRYVARYDTNGAVIFASCVGGLTGQDIAIGIRTNDGGTVSSFASASVFGPSSSNSASARE